jgi:hypothetical protein
MVASADARTERRDLGAIRHRFNGVVVECPRPLPFLPRADGNACARVAVSFLRGELLARGWPEVYATTHGDPPRPFWTVYRRDGRFLVRVHRFADFFVAADGSQITCQPHPATSDAVVDQLLADLVLPRVLHLQGRPCLHASAAALASGSVVALVAPSGSGKSTLCAALTARGARMLCDDALAPVVRHDGIRLASAYPSVRVWPDSAEAVFGTAEFPSATPRVGKLRVERPFAEEGHALACVLLLSPDGNAPRVTTPTKRDALQRLTHSVHRLVGDHVGSMAAEFSVLSEIVARVPVRRLHFRHDYADLDRVATLIEATAAVTSKDRPGRDVVDRR